MDNQRITVEQLSDAIMTCLNDYVGVTDEACDKGVSETAKTALQELRSAHPAGSGEYGSWNKYNRGWKVMQTKTDKRYHRKATIHNATDYRLTHLLEKGHAKVNGGRTRAFPHIAPVAQKAEDELLNNIKKQL